MEIGQGKTGDLLDGMDMFLPSEKMISRIMETQRTVVPG